jgi:hypothetical protein
MTGMDPTSNSIWLAFANFSRYLGLVFILMMMLMLGEGLRSQPDFPLISAMASSLYFAIVFFPVFAVSGAILAIAIQSSRSNLVWVATVIITHPIAPVLTTIWLAPGCRYSTVWEPLCSSEIRSAMFLDTPGTWIFVASHLIASLLHIWGHRRRAQRLVQQ